MQVPGPWQGTTIASSGTESSEIDLSQEFDFIQVILPALDSCTLSLKVSTISGGTFQTLGVGSLVTATTTGSRSSTLNLGGWRFVKIVSSATQTASRSISVRGLNAS